jgi:hypothetical protein
MLYYTESSNIIFGGFVARTKIDLNKAKEIVADRLELMKGGKHFAILDISNVKEITYEARKYLIQKDGGMKNILGVAFVANNPVSELLASILVKTSRNVEAGVFKSRKKATDWIFEIRSKLHEH